MSAPMSWRDKDKTGVVTCSANDLTDSGRNCAADCSG